MRVYLMISEKTPGSWKVQPKMDFFEVGKVGEYERTVEPKKMWGPRKKTILLTNRPFYQSMVVSGF